MDEAEANAPLFHDVVLTVIGSDDLDSERKLAILEVVRNGGGRFIPYNESEQELRHLSDLTHIVSTHIDFPQYNAALENGIHIVKPSWVTASANKNRQAQPRQHSPDPSQFFHDVVLTTANLPEGDKDAIIAGVFALGGQYSGPLSKLCTHIVTNDMNHDKVRMAQEKHTKCKIVLPHWFDDCFKLGRMIGERPYMFPDPELLRMDLTTRVREFPSPHLDGATAATPSDPPDSSPPPSPTKVRKNLNALMCKKILLSEDLKIKGTPLHETLLGLIHHAGGTVTTNAEECDIYIGQYRDGKDYVKASRAGKTVANLSWLYHVINRNKYTNPLSKLLHYPIPRNGLPGFEHMKISVSNYTGDARIYLENLIKYCGAEFTKTMKQDNTHLITAHTQSEKCEAAKEWNINVVNHIWLEESYAKCSVQTLSNPRYTTFPARTNLGEVTGQTSFDMKRVEQAFFPKPRDSPQKPTQPPPTASTAKPSPRKTASSALASRTTHVLDDDAPTPIQQDDDDATEAQPSTTKKARGRPPKSASTPRLRDDEKENESPLATSSGRASKNKALDRLHDQAPDIALFQKEMKRKGGVTHGGRRSSLAEDLSSPLPAKERKKRTSDEASFEDSRDVSDLSDGETQEPSAKPSKRVKSAPTPVTVPPVEHKLLVSGDERWLGNQNQEARDRNKLRQLGVMLTTDPKNVDILVAPKILRTRKFVTALASAPMVVHTNFLDVALKQDMLIPNPPRLHDPEGEEKFGFKLSEALERAKINHHKLLRGWSIFVTKEVNGGFETYKDIIEVNGGTAYLYAGRTGLTLPKRRLRPEDDDHAGAECQHQGGEEEFDYVYLISGKSEPEVKLWKTFTALAEKQGLHARVVDTSWLLDAAMSQQVAWKEDYSLQ